MAVTFNTTTHQPILYRVLPGNINDCQTVLDLLTRFDEFKLNTPTCAAALDRGYFSDENLLLAHEIKAKCIFTAKTSVGWIEETIERARAEFFDSKKGILSVESTLNNGVVQGVTIERRLKVNGKRFAVFAHIFKSERTASFQRERLYDELNKFESLWESRPTRTKTLRREPLMKYFDVIENGEQPATLVRDQDAIKEAVKNAGIFVGVTTWRCTAQECYDFYGYRSDIERVFRSGKSDFNMNVQRTHNDRTMEGKCFVSFVQLALLEELKQRLATDQEKRLKSGRKRVEIAKHTFDADEVIASKPDGIMITNGPGDPAECVEIIEQIKILADAGIPIFAICLGHQLMALAHDAKTFKMKYGHRGANHPVKNLETGKVYISSQNHGYVVDTDTLDPAVAKPAFVNVNDGTNEGLEYIGKNIFTVQFHPEACPGPQDSAYLFDRFIEMMEQSTL